MKRGCLTSSGTRTLADRRHYVGRKKRATRGGRVLEDLFQR